MSQAPTMPVFTDALVGDTTHLSAEEFGCYFLLLMATWRNNGQPLRDDDERLARICRVTKANWRSRIRAALVGFFTLSDGNWRQKRLEKEWNSVTERIGIARKNGVKGGRPKSLTDNDSPKPTGYENQKPNGTVEKAIHIHIQDTSKADALEDRGDAPSTIAQTMADVWREELSGVLPIPTRLRGPRTNVCVKRWRENFGKDAERWRAHCRAIRGSHFLCGANERGWKADFDWALTPKAIIGIEEGKYADRDQPAPDHTDPRRQRAVAERRSGLDTIARYAGMAEGMGAGAPGSGDPGGGGPIIDVVPERVDPGHAAANLGRDGAADPGIRDAA